MKRKLIIAVLALVVVGATLVALRNIIVRSAAESLIERVLGVEATIGSVSTGLFPGSIECETITVRSPAGFGDETMVEIHSLKARYSPLALLSRRLVLKSLDINISQITVVKNKQGKVNVEVAQDRFADSGGPAPSKRAGGAWKLQIDRGVMRVGKILLVETKPDGTLKTTQVGLKIRNVTLRNLDLNDVYHGLGFVLRTVTQGRSAGRGI